MRLNLDFSIAMGKWVLFSILILVIVYGSYYSLFGLREGFEPGTCPKGCWQRPEGDVDGNCMRYNVEDGHNKFNLTDSAVKSIPLMITPGHYTGKKLAAELEKVIKGSGITSTSKFTATFHHPDDSAGKDMRINELEFNLNGNDSDTVTIDFNFDPDKIYAPHESPLASLFKMETVSLTGSNSVYTPIDLTPWFPSDLKPTSICPQVCTWGGYEGGITKDKDYCQYDADCSACDPVVCPQGNCPPVKKKNPYPPPPPSKKGRGDDGGGDDGGGDDGGGDETDVLDCTQAKCYEQPDAGSNKQFNRYDPRSKKRGPNDPKYDEDVGFCGIEYMDKSGKKFMFGCSSSDTCAKLDCNTACKRDPKTKEFVGDCRIYPKHDAKGGGDGGDGNIDDEEDRMDNRSSNSYYDSDMDDYMNELMRPGQMTPNQMYNFRQARYGCDSSKYGCCADGFTFKKDASGNNCFDFLPYYNPILFRGGA